ncbi:MAG: PhzF family phenazine biosynthesis protein [bacterium]|nr:PhzF family phenazine biosynthesis protein [bacterium]
MGGYSPPPTVPHPLWRDKARPALTSRGSTDRMAAYHSLNTTGFARHGHIDISGWSPMPTYRVLQADVFTDRPFGGNPVAVLPEAEGLDEATMQQIAREMNLSETAFVFPPTAPGADVRVRFFTPEREIPFAGHPTLGTHYLLALEGRYELREPVTRIHQEIGLGVLPVDLHVSGGGVAHVVMTQDLPTFGPEATHRGLVTKALSLTPEALAPGHPVQVVSTGLPHLIIPLSSLKAIEAARVDLAAMDELAETLEVDCFMPFSLETVDPAKAVHVRMFAPRLGVPEDPATGSGSGALGAYLARHKLVKATSPTTVIVSEQGLEAGRPSTVRIEVDGTDDITAVRVGGQVVKVMEGTLTF